MVYRTFSTPTIGSSSSVVAVAASSQQRAHTHTHSTSTKTYDWHIFCQCFLQSEWVYGVFVWAEKASPNIAIIPVAAIKRCEIQFHNPHRRRKYSCHFGNVWIDMSVMVVYLVLGIWIESCFAIKNSQLSSPHGSQSRTDSARTSLGLFYEIITTLLCAPRRNVFRCCCCFGAIASSALPTNFHCV